MIDSGGIQKDALTVDPLASLESYYNNIYLHYDILLKFEITFLKEMNIDMILVDVSSLPCAAGKLLNIPSIIVSNFTWDFCFKELLEIICSDINIPVENLGVYRQMIDQCSSDYCDASYYIQFPGGTPLPKGFKELNVIHAPLTSRYSKLSESSGGLIELRNQLNIPKDSRILLLGFGGFQISGVSTLEDFFLPEDWVCLVLTGDMNRTKSISASNVYPSSRWISIDGSAYIPDLVNLADVMIGKIGYGTCSECICHGTPLIYVPRANWPEERYLERMLLSYGAGICMPVTDFKTGNWTEYLINAYNSKGKWDWQSLNNNGSYDVIVDILESIFSLPV